MLRATNRLTCGSPGFEILNKPLPVLKHDHGSPKKARAEGKGSHNANSFSIEALLNCELAKIKMQTLN